MTCLHFTSILLYRKAHKYAYMNCTWAYSHIHDTLIKTYTGLAVNKTMKTCSTDNSMYNALDICECNAQLLWSPDRVWVCSRRPVWTRAICARAGGQEAHVKTHMLSHAMPEEDPHLPMLKLHYPLLASFCLFEIFFFIVRFLSIFCTITSFNFLVPGVSSSWIYRVSIQPYVSSCSFLLNFNNKVFMKNSHLIYSLYNENKVISEGTLRLIYSYASDLCCSLYTVFIYTSASLSMMTYNYACRPLVGSVHRNFAGEISAVMVATFVAAWLVSPSLFSL